MSFEAKPQEVLVPVLESADRVWRYRPVENCKAATKYLKISSVKILFVALDPFDFSSLELVEGVRKIALRFDAKMYTHSPLQFNWMPNLVKNLGSSRHFLELPRDGELTTLLAESTFCDD